MVVADKIALSFAEFSLLKDNVVLIDYTSEERINVEKGIAMFRAIQKLTNGSPCFIIHNFGDKYIFQSDAMRFMASQLDLETHNFLGRAYVTTNAASRIAVNNFIKFYKPVVTTKLFSEIEPVITWVEDFTTSGK